MRNTNPHRVVTGVVAGIVLGLSVAQAMYTFTRPPAPQPISITVQLSNGGSGGISIPDINTAERVSEGAGCSSEQCDRITVARGPATP